MVEFDKDNHIVFRERGTSLIVDFYDKNAAEEGKKVKLGEIITSKTGVVPPVVKFL